MIQLVVSDIDGTLLQDGANAIPPAIFEQIARLKERGIRSEIAAYRSRFETAASIDEKREMLSRINALTKKLGLLK